MPSYTTDIEYTSAVGNRRKMTPHINVHIDGNFAYSMFGGDRDDLDPVQSWLSAFARVHDRISHAQHGREDSTPIAWFNKKAARAYLVSSFDESAGIRFDQVFGGAEPVTA